MPYDIYGNNLREGFCEVHPQVNEYYPCRICYDEAKKEENRRKEYDQQKEDYYKAMEQEYYKENDPQHQIQKLEADKAELLSILKGLVSDVGNLIGEHDIEWQQAGYFEYAKELIQKHKQ